MDKRGQERHQVDATLLSLVQRERSSSSTACAGVQSWELPSHAGNARADPRLVADEPTREAHQDRREGRQPWPLRRVSDGGSRDPAQTLRADSATDRRPTVASGMRRDVNRVSLAADKRREICVPTSAEAPFSPPDRAEICSSGRNGLRRGAKPRDSRPGGALFVSNP
jgi:hypothetical protein